MGPQQADHELLGLSLGIQTVVTGGSQYLFLTSQPAVRPVWGGLPIGLNVQREGREVSRNCVQEVGMKVELALNFQLTS